MQFMETIYREVATWPYPEAVFVINKRNDSIIGPFPTRELANNWAENYMAPNDTDWVLQILENEVPLVP